MAKIESLAQLIRKRASVDRWIWRDAWHTLLRHRCSEYPQAAKLVVFGAIYNLAFLFFGSLQSIAWLLLHVGGNLTILGCFVWLAVQDWRFGTLQDQLKQEITNAGFGSEVQNFRVIPAFPEISRRQSLAICLMPAILVVCTLGVSLFLQVL